MKVYTYPVDVYPFHALCQDIFSLNSSLEGIHVLDTGSSDVMFDNDTATVFQTTFYSSNKYTVLREMYYTFVRNEIAKLFPNETYLVIQKDPQFRVCCPEKTALGRKYTDDNTKIGLHCDADYYHPPQEWNFIIAVTEMWETNSVFVESSPNKGDFQPLKLHWNEYVMFNGNKCRHHNMVNKTGQSRVSLDFRVIPFSVYDGSYTGKSVHGKRSFTIGDYFIKLPVNDQK